VSRRSERQPPSESQALREVRRALRWLRKAEATLAKYERAQRMIMRAAVYEAVDKRVRPLARAAAEDQP